LVSTKDGYHVLDPRTDSLSLIYPFEADTATRPARTLQAWSRDGRYLFLGTSAKERWARGVERYDLTARNATALASDANVYAAMHVSDDGSRFVFERSEGDRPNEVYTAGRDFADAHASPSQPQLACVACPTGARGLSRRRRQAVQRVLYYPYGTSRQKYRWSRKSTRHFSTMASTRI
jgi:dipeptidyl aminopeptidase/acylaminoacyl peptidase